MRPMFANGAIGQRIFGDIRNLLANATERLFVLFGATLVTIREIVRVTIVVNALCKGSLFAKERLGTTFSAFEAVFAFPAAAWHDLEWWSKTIRS